MFTYGYIREATMAHLDIDEAEAQAMNLQGRFHIFANEAIQAICGSKPKYEYLDITVVNEYAPLVTDGAIIRLATKEEIKWDEEAQGPREFTILNKEQTKQYYNEQGIYETGDKIAMNDKFIAFADKLPIKIIEIKPRVEEILEAEAFGTPLKNKILREIARIDDDFSYIGSNQIKVYKPGRYLIPGRFMWYRFESGLGDETELEMPADILLTIPLYISSVCLQIDNPQKANIKRSEFEMALARCSATDFMPLNQIKGTW